jgi:hypothetical protein
MAVGAVYWFAEISKTKRRPLADTVTLSYAGFTTNSSGDRIGLFSIQNRSLTGITLMRAHEAQIETDGGWKRHAGISGPAIMIAAKASGVLQVPLPSTTQRWRVWLNYEDQLNVAAECLLLLKRLGWPVSFQNRTYSACSPVVDP